MSDESAGARVRNSVIGVLKGTGSIVQGATDVVRDSAVTTLRNTADVAGAVTSTAGSIVAGAFGAVNEVGRASCRERVYVLV